VTVDTQATFENPRRYPQGIEHVMVNGELAVRDGETTERLPGQAVRK
jgi:N-acyl-D-amino-acid deacylase